MSRKFVVPGATFTGPRLSPDPMVTVGTLALFDVTHPSNPWPTAALANGTVLPNIADRFARDVIGGGLAAGATNAVVSKTGTTNPQGRSPKGAYVWAKAGAGANLHIPIPVELLRYMLASQGHSHYFSWWGGTIYGGASPNLSGQILRVSGAASQAAGDVFFGLTGTGVANTEGGSYNSTTTDTAVVPRRHLGVSTAVTGTHGQTAEQAVLQSRFAGLQSPNFTPQGNTTQLLFQRFFLEDITVSGRSYAQLKALDDALYAETVSNSDGRYYGESYGTQVTLAST